MEFVVGLKCVKACSKKNLWFLVMRDQRLMKALTKATTNWWEKFLDKHKQPQGRKDEKGWNIKIQRHWLQNQQGEG